VVLIEFAEAADFDHARNQRKGKAGGNIANDA
jgi:hypothetical protein